MPPLRENDETVWVDVQQLNETEKAWLFGLVESGEEVWIPKSQVRAKKKDADGTIGRIEITKWMARQKGIVE